MGNLLSTRSNGDSSSELQANSLYRYPPKSGCYFGNYFIMGGEKFETSQPEGYLFGENNDLNFLGNKPLTFPYTAPGIQEPIRTLKSFVNIRKDTIRFVKVPDEIHCPNRASTMYNIEFVFDSDADISICIYYLATEEFVNGHLTFKTAPQSHNSQVYSYKSGAGQIFSQNQHIIDASLYTSEDKDGNTSEPQCVPIIIHCTVQDLPGHEHVTYASVERLSDGCYILKPLKQKHVIDGVCYLLQEIYGIENKNPERTKQVPDEDTDDNSCECVICMSELRDTLILPCRHLCLCKICADNLRYQANNCPICRAPFIALLRLKAVRRISDARVTPANVSSTDDDETLHGGYKALPLIVALNGTKTAFLQQSVPIAESAVATSTDASNSCINQIGQASNNFMESSLKTDNEQKMNSKDNLDKENENLGTKISSNSKTQDKDVIDRLSEQTSIQMEELSMSCNINNKQNVYDDKLEIDEQQEQHHSDDLHEVSISSNSTPQCSNDNSANSSVTSSQGLLIVSTHLKNNIELEHNLSDV